ncbi:glycosyltransferase [Candidatus Babeliales bacterium]|nr:glycosyltransferase [Candidatus Babeliales bacterium]
MGQDFHVLYIITKLELGGAQKVCLSLFKWFNKSKKQATLISGTDGPLVDEACSLGPTKLLPEFVREVGVSSLWREIKAFWRLFKEIRVLKKKYLHLVVHTHSSKAGVMGRWAAFFAGCRRIVHTVHGFSFNDRQPFYTRWMCICLEFFTSLVTSKFICVSQCDLRNGCVFFPWFYKKTCIIRAAVEDCKFIPTKRFKEPLNKNEIIIGSVGCFKPQKNLIDLLKAFKYLKDIVGPEKKMRLQILGDGVLRPSLMAWIRQHDLEQLIDLPGWQDNVESWMSSWDIFAMSSLWEGLPRAVVEARMSRLPVVAYDVGGIGEIIKNGENGFIVSPGEWEKLTHYLQLLVDDAEFRSVLANGQNEKFSDFYVKIMIKKHEQLYLDQL